MEIRFKNSYTRNKGLAKEIYRYYYFQRKLLIACYVFLAASFFANIVCALVEHTYHMVVFIVVPLIFALQFFCYFHQVNTMIKRDQEMYGKEVEVETIVTESFIQNTASTGAVNQVEYDKIRNAVQTKNLILLRSKANLIYIFNKNTFAVGTKDAFVSFLRAKGIQVKGK